MIVISIETTGLPGGDWDPRVIAVGLAEARGDGTLGEHSGGYVRQPREHVYHPATDGAFEANSVSRDAIVNAPNTVASVTAHLRRITAEQQLFAFNVQFHKKFLTGAPWHVTTWGGCLQQAAAHHIKGRGKKRISLPAALAWLGSQGVDVHAGTDDMHPTEAKAVRVARLAIELAKVHEGRG